MAAVYFHSNLSRIAKKSFRRVKSRQRCIFTKEELKILFEDFNNSDLMQELQRQDSEYLEKIIEQNDKIINLLEERRNDHE